MSDVLARICDDKRAWVARRSQEVPLNEVLLRAVDAHRPRRFADRLAAVSAEGFGLIAEIKKASPSKGVIRTDFDPATLARAYAAGGAACLSVLTDVPYFQGGDDHLRAARAATSLPVLRKDFIIDTYQILESRSLGADCVLLIMAALDDAMARDLRALARDFGMDVLVEVHDEAELDRALALDVRLIGINNRNLKTLGVDLGTTLRLAPRVPADRIVVCESGISGHDDIARMAEAGVRCFLVGESLMREDDVAAAVRQLLGPSAVPLPPEPPQCPN